MKIFSKSFKKLIGLVGTLAILAAINVYSPQGDFAPRQEIPISKPVLVMINLSIGFILYGGLGFIGMKLSQKVWVSGSGGFHFWTDIAWHIIWGLF